MELSRSSVSPFIRFATELGNGVKSFGAQRLQQKEPAPANIAVDLSHSSGAALAFRRRVQLLGVTPSPREIQGIIDWLKASHIDPLLYTTQLGRYHLPALRFRDKATGLLAVCIDHTRAEYLLFFKPPMEHSIRWVDGPEEGGAEHTSMNQTVTADTISQPWTQSEIATALRLRKELQELQ